MNDPLHPADRSWIDYHERMGMTRDQALKSLATYRAMVEQIIGRKPDADISDVVASAEKWIGELMQKRPWFDPVILSMVRSAADDVPPTLRNAILQAHDYIARATK